MDALCLDDLDQFGGELDDPLAELAQDLYHRVIEAPGSNFDDVARGYGLEGKLSGGNRGATFLTDIKQGLEAEMRKDSRVLEARAEVTSPATGEYEAHIDIVCDEGELGIKLEADGAGVRRVA